MVINYKNHNKKESCSSLTPIASPVRYRSGAAKILLCWDSAQKITSSVRYRSGAADSGTLHPENAHCWGF
ncbi:hypothetical protein FLAVO9R_120086 [Flavobacterium sp. 9R]|nr:hypothetical protein FLAVO9R_120086 [Flavobacterium sp. 9R]